MVYALFFHDLSYYYDMKLGAFGYDKYFNLLPQFPVSIKPLHPKNLEPYINYRQYLCPSKDYNIKANFYTWLQPRKDYLAMTEINYTSLMSKEVSNCKHT